MPSPQAEPARVNTLGVAVSAVDMAQAMSVMDDWIARGDRQYVCVTGAHGVIESQSDVALREIHNRAGLVVPDGMPLVWVARSRGHRHVRRVPGPDLMPSFCRHSVEKGYRHFFYGGKEGVPERLEANLTRRFPGLRVVGTYSPPFRPMTPEEDDEIVRRINESGADIVWVGLSTPKQERWMASHRSRLTAPVLLGVGAAFDFNAGLKEKAPVWMQQAGLEWSFRLATEPKRLWRRYLRVVPSFILLIGLQTLKLRRYSIDLQTSTPDRVSH